MDAKSGSNKGSADGIRWGSSLILLAAAVFMFSLGMGLQSGISTNFMKELGLTDSQVLLQQGFRELPGLCLMFVAALTTRLSLTWRATVALLIMGVGSAFVCDRAFLDGTGSSIDFSQFRFPFVGTAQYLFGFDAGG